MVVTLQKMMTMKLRDFFLPFLVCISCVKLSPETPERPSEPTESVTAVNFSKPELARILSSLPIGSGQVEEVFDAVGASSGNGYDEEYTMEDLFRDPGSGVGGSGTKSQGKEYEVPLKELFEQYFAASRTLTKSEKGFSVQDCINALISSGYQIYWPYSELWDGETMPLITYDPGYGAESNYAYEICAENGAYAVTDSVLVTEETAITRPVWVINSNTDSAFSPLDLFIRYTGADSAIDGVESQPGAGTKSGNRILRLKSINMLKNYDSWFGGASEFFIQAGTVEGFSASTEAELKLYYPTLTSFMVVVRRNQKGMEVPLDIIMMTDFTNQLDKIAFLVTEDDGGTTTSWKCAATVKVQSKSYGFDVDFPYKDKDDIVWRGQLTASFFQSEDIVSARFGDVILSFELQ